MDHSLGIYAVGIIYVIRDEQAAIRVKAHAVLIALFFPRQQNQIGQKLVAKNSSAPGCRVRPSNPAVLFDHRLRCFEFVNKVEEFPALPQWECLNLFQYLMRAHV